MSKATLLVLCVIALVAGVGWVVTSRLPLIFAVGVVALMLCLGGLSWRLGE